MILLFTADLIHLFCVCSLIFMAKCLWMTSDELQEWILWLWSFITIRWIQRKVCIRVFSSSATTEIDSRGWFYCCTTPCTAIDCFLSFQAASVKQNRKVWSHLWPPFSGYQLWLMRFTLSVVRIVFLCVTLLVINCSLGQWKLQLRVRLALEIIGHLSLKGK